MERVQCLEQIHSELEDMLVVTIMGACAQELYDLGHRENFFYLQHAMGLASSIGLARGNRKDDHKGCLFVQVGISHWSALFFCKNCTGCSFVKIVPAASFRALTRFSGLVMMPLVPPLSR